MNKSGGKKHKNFKDNISQNSAIVFQNTRNQLRKEIYTLITIYVYAHSKGHKWIE